MFVLIGVGSVGVSLWFGVFRWLYILMSVCVGRILVLFMSVVLVVFLVGSMKVWVSGVLLLVGMGLCDSVYVIVSVL